MSNNNPNDNNFMKSFEHNDKNSVDPYSFENIDSGFMPDINDKYFYLKCYILDAVKNIKPPYYYLDFNEFNEYTKDIEGWKENINNNHTIISGLIDRALIKAGVDRKKIKNCILSEEHFVVHDREFPIDALNHRSISVYNENYNATINNNQQPYTAFSIYKTGYDKRDDDESMKKLLSENENKKKENMIKLFREEKIKLCNPESDTTYKPNRNPTVKFAKAEVVYVDNTFYNTPQKNKEYNNNNTNYPYKKKYAMPEKENSYTGDEMFCEKINPITEDIKLDKYYDFTKNIKQLALFNQIYNILLDYAKTQEYDVSIAGDNIGKAQNNTIAGTAQKIGDIFQKKSKEQDIEPVSYGVNSLKYILSKVNEKGFYEKTDITQNNNDMIPLFRIFISRYDRMIAENIGGSKRPIGSSYNTASI